MELSPASYLLLCGLVKDALEIETDATPLLRKAARELGSAMDTQEGAVPMEVAAKADVIGSLKTVTTTRS